MVTVFSGVDADFPLKMHVAVTLYVEREVQG
jgi:hypothetical protein